MASKSRRSRTTTRAWRRIRDQVLAEAIDNGVIVCPLCGVALSYHVARRPESPEVDHIVPVALGGTDDRSNLRVICKLCNMKLGAQVTNQKRARLNSQRVTNLVEW